MSPARYSGKAEACTLAAAAEPTANACVERHQWSEGAQACHPAAMVSAPVQVLYPCLSATLGCKLPPPSPAVRGAAAAPSPQQLDTGNQHQRQLIPPSGTGQEPTTPSSYRLSKQAFFLSGVVTKVRCIASLPVSPEGMATVPTASATPVPDQPLHCAMPMQHLPPSPRHTSTVGLQRPPATVADAVQVRPAHACSGLAADQLPVLQRLRRFITSGHQPATLSVGEVEGLAASAIAAAVDTSWAGELWVPSRRLTDLHEPRLIYCRPGRCCVLVASYASQALSCEGSCLAIKEVPLQLDPVAVTHRQPHKLPLVAFGELQGLRRVSGRPGCQRLLAWSVVQDAAGASPGAFKLLLVTRHCPGGTLQQLLAQSAQPGGRPVCVHGYLGILLQVTETLAALQAEGIVHGDMKPDNVFLDEGGRPVVADWEGAVRFPAGVRPNAQHEHSPSTMARQYAAHFMRTERYAGLEQLLPEIAAGQADHPLWKLWNHLSDAAKAEMCNSGRMERFVSYSSDVYSLGVMLADASQLCSFERVQPDMRESLALDMFYMASECCHPLPWQRPTMVKLLLRLHTAATAVRCVKSPCPATVASSA